MIRRIVYILVVGNSFASSMVGQEGTPRPDTVYAADPVLVTATRATLRSSPVTFSSFNRADIQKLYTTQDIPMILSDLPSVTSYSENGSGIGYTYINLRGFDQRRISVMINGIPQNDPEDHNVYWIDFPELLASAEEIQIQRGAGSAFYGPPAIGGSVNIIANPFRTKPGVTLESVIGLQEFGADSETRVSTRKQSVSINSGWIDQKTMLYGRLGRIRADGYRDLGWVNLDSYFLGALRVDGAMTTRLHVFGGPIADGLTYVGLPKEYNADLKLRRTNYSYWEYDSTGNSVGYAVTQKRGALENFSQPHAELLHDWTLSDGVSLHTSVFYVRGDGFFNYDGDWLPYTPPAADWFRRHVGYDSTFGVSSFPTFLIRGVVENRQWGILPRLEVKHAGGRMTLGLELRTHRSDHYGEIRFASAAPSESFDNKQRIYTYEGVRDIVSVYVHEAFELQPNVTLVGDLQVVYNTYGIRNEQFIGTSFTVDYLFANPRLGLHVNFDENLHGYAFAGYTSREPRLRNLYAAEDAYFGATPEFKADTSGGNIVYDFSAPLAKPEQLFDVEVGAGWVSPSLRLTANAFWMEFTNELVKSGQVDIFGQPVTGNAGRTRHLGVEVEGEGKVTETIRISGNVSVSRNILVEYASFEGGSAVSYDGKPIAGFPDFLGNLSATYDDGQTAAVIAGKYVGAFFTDNTGNPKFRNEAYTTLSVTVLQRCSLPWSVDAMLRGEVRNLLNSLYTTGGEGNSFFPAAERNYVFGLTLSL